MQYDPTAALRAARSFSWAAQPEDNNPAADLQPGLRHQLKQTVASALARQGLQPVGGQSGQPDLLIATYLHARTETHQWTSSTWGYPYGPWGPSAVGPLSGPYPAGPYSAGPWYTSGSAGIEHWRVTTLVIDLIDRKKNQLAWRGSGQVVADDEAREEPLLKLAAAIIQRFPPAIAVEKPAHR